MAEYTPTTEQIRGAHAEVYHLSSYGLTGREEANELFDRWLASVKRDAVNHHHRNVAMSESDLAEHDAALVERMADELPMDCHDPRHMADWLRARAAELRQGKA